MTNIFTKTAKKLMDEGAHAMHRRSFMKAVSWRTLGSIDTFILSWIITGKLHLGVFIASAEVVTKIALYYFHERAWARIKWGLRQS